MALCGGELCQMMTARPCLVENRRCGLGRGWLVAFFALDHPAPGEPSITADARVTEFLSQRFGDLAKVSCLSQNRPEDRSADF